MNNAINICLATDDNYYKYAGVVITSILVNAHINDKLKIYILDGGITEEHKKELESLKKFKEFNLNFVKINSKLFDDYKNIKTQKHISIATYYRLKMSELIPDINKIIYLDCDMVVNSSLRELFNTDLDSFYFAGVKDIDKKKTKENPSYVNAGMLLMNLDLIKKDSIVKEFLAWTKENTDKITLGDQTIINEVCKNRIKLLDNTWNLQSASFINRSDFIKEPKIIHFCGADKPWTIGCQSYHRKYYFKYLQESPWIIKNNYLLKWRFFNEIVSLYKFIKHRPLFFLQKKYWNAVIKTINSY